MLRFDLNLTLTLAGMPFLERFDAAARLGFAAVEFAWPAGEDPDTVARRAADCGLRAVLINFDGGDLSAGERGFLNDPSRRERFRANVPQAIDLAQRTGCRTLNALAGKWLPGVARVAQLDLVREQLRFACEQAAAAGITVVVEGLNAWDNGPYLYTNTRETLAFLETVGAPNLRYQYDVYHMQRMEGNLIATIGAFAPRFGHIQVADAPARGQPGTGEVNFRNVFAAIDASAYDGWIGVEYVPQGPAEASLAWLPPDRRRPIAPGDLRL